MCLCALALRLAQCYAAMEGTGGDGDGYSTALGALISRDNSIDEM